MTSEREKLVLVALVVGAVVFASIGAAAGAAIAGPWREIYDDWKATYRAAAKDAASAMRSLHQVSAGKLAFQTWLHLWDPLGLFNPATQRFDAVPESGAGGASTGEF